MGEILGKKTFTIMDCVDLIDLLTKPRCLREFDKENGQFKMSCLNLISSSLHENLSVTIRLTQPPFHKTILLISPRKFV
jgi:hypothetical protein